MANTSLTCGTIGIEHYNSLIIVMEVDIQKVTQNTPIWPFSLFSFYASNSVHIFEEKMIIMQIILILIYLLGS